MFEDIHSVTSMEEIMSHMNEDVFLMLDIDHTLIEPVQTMGSVAWEKNLFQLYLREGFSFEEADKKAFERWKEVQHVTKVKPVEEKTGEWIRQCRDLVFHVFGLTARSNYLSNLTKSQLSLLEMDELFTREIEDFEFLLPHPASFIEGILYCGHNQKGAVLESFLKKNKLNPSKIICVDDQRDCLTELSQRLKKLKISFTGFHYPLCNIRPYDHRIALVQEKHFPHLLTDEEAFKLLS